MEFGLEKGLMPLTNEEWITNKRLESLKESQTSVTFWRQSLDQDWRRAVLIATPISVWNEYRANGYTMHDAIREECGVRR